MTTFNDVWPFLCALIIELEGDIEDEPETLAIFSQNMWLVKDSNFKHLQ